MVALVTHTPVDGYRCRFGTIWTLAILEIFGVIATLVVCIWALSDENIRNPGPNNGAATLPEVVVPLTTTAFVLCTIAIAILVGMFLPRSQMRFRAGSGILGAIFGTCFERSSTAPSDMASVIALFYATRERNWGNKQSGKPEKDITPVGGAWSCSLAQRFLLPFPRMYTHNLAGRVGGNGRTWLAGTTLKTVQSELAKSNQQLIGVPSSSYVTIGAWVATLAHGTAGAAFTYPLLRVSARVLDKKTGVVSDDTPAKLLDKFGASEGRARQFVVLTVTLPDNVPQNQSLRRSCFLVRNEDDAARFLRETTLMRALFVGQSASLAMTWTPLKSGDAKPSGATVLDKLRIFALAGLGWGAPDLDKKDTEERVSDAVYFFPDTITNIQNLVQVYMALVNAEFYTTDLTFSDEGLLDVAQRLQNTHSKLGGRTEIRIHNDVVYFDVAIRETHRNFAMYLERLRDLGVRRVGQHRGKHRRVREEFERAGLELVEAREVVG